MALGEESFRRFAGQSMGSSDANIFAATITKGDMLWVPAGWMMAERVHSSAHHISLRLASLATSFRMRAELSTLSVWTPDPPTKAMFSMMDSAVKENIA